MGLDFFLESLVVFQDFLQLFLGHVLDFGQINFLELRFDNSKKFLGLFDKLGHLSFELVEDLGSLLKGFLGSNAGVLDHFFVVRFVKRFGDEVFDLSNDVHGLLLGFLHVNVLDSLGDGINRSAADLAHLLFSYNSGSRQFVHHAVDAFLVDAEHKFRHLWGQFHLGDNVIKDFLVGFAAEDNLDDAVSLELEGNHDRFGWGVVKLDGGFPSNGVLVAESFEGSNHVLVVSAHDNSNSVFARVSRQDQRFLGHVNLGGELNQHLVVGVEFEENS